MILGIDFGQRHIGLALSEGELATPYKSLTYTNLETLFTTLFKEIQDREVTSLVVGISEGKSRAAALKFADRLTTMLQLPLSFIDETLTSIEAQNIISSPKEKLKEHSVAAALILQRYLDERR